MDVSGAGANVSALAIPPYAGPPRQTIAGGEVQAEFLSLRQINKHAHLRVSPFTLDSKSFAGTVSLFAVANFKAAFAAVVRTVDPTAGQQYAIVLGSTSSIRNTLKSGTVDDGLVPYQPQRTFDLGPDRPVVVKFAARDERLLVGFEAGPILVYDVTAFLNPDVRPVPHTFPGDAVGYPRLIVPNPGDHPELVAVLRGIYGSERGHFVEILDVVSGNLVGGWHSIGNVYAMPMSLAWSPRGKQIAIGTHSGDILLYAPQDASQLKGHVPRISDPELADNCALAVTWLTNNAFHVVYSHPSAAARVDIESIGIPDQAHYIINHDHRNPAASNEIKLAENPAMPFGAKRTPGPSSIVLRNWGTLKVLLFAGDGPSADVGAIGQVGEQWGNLATEETSRAALPLTADMDESGLMGLDLDLSSTELLDNSESPGDGIPPGPPAPILMAYTTEGVLCAWHIISRNDGAYPGMVTQVASASPTSAMSILAPTPAAPAPPPVTNPALAFGSQSTATTSPFGAPTAAAPAFGSTGFGTAAAGAAPAFGSTGFGTKPTSTSAAGPSSSGGGFGSFAAKPVGFGDAAKPAASPFGATAPSTTSPFGSAASSSPFGAGASSTSAFGGAATKPSPFGSATTASPFGAGASSPDNKPATANSPFGTAGSSTSAFSTTATKPSPFGSATTGSPFGTAPAATASSPETKPAATSPFATASSSSSVFGNVPASSPFASAAQKPASATTTPTFGFGAAAAKNSPSGFGSTGFGFGVAAPAAPTFGQPTAPAGAPAFGQPTGFGVAAKPAASSAPAGGAFSAFASKPTTFGGAASTPKADEKPAAAAAPATSPFGQAAAGSTFGQSGFGGFTAKPAASAAPAAAPRPPAAPAQSTTAARDTSSSDRPGKAPASPASSAASSPGSSRAGSPVPGASSKSSLPSTGTFGTGGFGAFGSGTSSFVKPGSGFGAFGAKQTEQPSAFSLAAGATTPRTEGVASAGFGKPAAIVLGAPPAVAASGGAAPAFGKPTAFGQPSFGQPTALTAMAKPKAVVADAKIATPTSGGFANFSGGGFSGFAPSGRATSFGDVQGADKKAGDKKPVDTVAPTTPVKQPEAAKVFDTPASSKLAGGFTLDSTPRKPAKEEEQEDKPPQKEVFPEDELSGKEPEKTDNDLTFESLAPGGSKGKEKAPPGPPTPTTPTRPTNKTPATPPSVFSTPGAKSAFSTPPAAGAMSSPSMTPATPSSAPSPGSQAPSTPSNADFTPSKTPATPSLFGAFAKPAPVAAAFNFGTPTTPSASSSDGASPTKTPGTPGSAFNFGTPKSGTPGSSSPFGGPSIFGPKAETPKAKPVSAFGPTTPATPATPQTVGTPATPQTVGTPATPQTVGTPATPQTVGTPATPQTVGTPATPQTVGTPATPQTNRTPATPQTAQTPATPEPLSSPGGSLLSRLGPPPPKRVEPLPPDSDEEEDPEYDEAEGEDGDGDPDEEEDEEEDLELTEEEEEGEEGDYDDGEEEQDAGQNSPVPATPAAKPAPPIAKGPTDSAFKLPTSAALQTPQPTTSTPESKPKFFGIAPPAKPSMFGTPPRSSPLAANPPFTAEGSGASTATPKSMFSTPAPATETRSAFSVLSQASQGTPAAPSVATPTSAGPFSKFPGFTTPTPTFALSGPPGGAAASSPAASTGGTPNFFGVKPPTSAAATSSAAMPSISGLTPSPATPPAAPTPAPAAPNFFSFKPSTPSAAPATSAAQQPAASSATPNSFGLKPQTPATTQQPTSSTTPNFFAPKSQLPATGLSLPATSSPTLGASQLKPQPSQSQPLHPVPGETPLQQQFAQLFIQASRDIEHLALAVQGFGQTHAKFCAPKGGQTPADLVSPERWGIGDLIPFTQVVRSFERDVNAAKVDVEKLYEQVFEFSGQMTNADVSKEQLKLYKLSRSDEEFQRAVMERDLGPEQKQLQEKIRKQIQLASERLEQLEGVVESWKRRLEMSGRHRIEAPTLDVVNRTCRNMDIVLEQRAADIAALLSRVNAVGYSSRHPAHANGSSSYKATPAAQPFNSRQASTKAANAALVSEQTASRLRDLLERSRPTAVMTIVDTSRPPMKTLTSPPTPKPTPAVALPPAPAATNIPAGELPLRFAPGQMIQWPRPSGLSPSPNPSPAPVVPVPDDGLLADRRAGGSSGGRNRKTLHQGSVKIGSTRTEGGSAPAATTAPAFDWGPLPARLSGNS